jgi:hypothetical protein
MISVFMDVMNGMKELYSLGYVHLNLNVRMQYAIRVDFSS